MNALETRLREHRDAGRSLLVPYLTAGISADWLDLARAYADAGADAIEIGIPFSDPMLDGTAVQLASQRALQRGTTASSVFREIAGLSLDVPLIAMTYSNVARRPSEAVFAQRLRAAGFAGLIVVDTPADEAESLDRASTEADLDLVLLIAPSTPEYRVARIARQSRGFVYAATVMGPTGERDGLAAEAARLAVRVRRHSRLPVLLGFGISTPADAAAAAAVADGVVIGSVLMRRVLAGVGPAELGREVARFRAAVDAEAR